jgi:hypothetical protein
MITIVKEGCIPKKLEPIQLIYEPCCDNCNTVFTCDDDDLEWFTLGLVPCYQFVYCPLCNSHVKVDKPKNAIIQKF